MPVQRTLEQRRQRQSQHATEGVDADFAVGPVEHGTPTQEVRVFHLPEGAGTEKCDPSVAAIIATRNRGRRGFQPR